MHLERADSAYLARITVKPPKGFWRLHRNGIEPPGPDSPVVIEPPAQAFIVRAAWRVQCPFCASSQFGNPETQTRFVCVECGNAQVDGAWLAVEWPQDRDEIEQTLLARKNPTRMHWYPHEAVEHLHAQNIEHGVHPLEHVPKTRQRLVKFLVEAGKEINPVHAIAPGCIVHPDSEWFPKLHAEIVKGLGKNVSESDIRKALMR